MAATEDRIISKVVRTRDISEVLERGISAEWFADSTSKAVFTSLVKHYSTYGEIPSGPTVQSNFPTYTLFDVKDSVEYLIDTFVAERRRSKVYELIRDAVDIGVDPKRYEDVVHLIQARMADLDGDLPGFHDMNLADSPLSRLAQYDELKARGTSLLGVPTGFATIDRATAGLQNGQLVTIVASPKVGKASGLSEPVLTPRGWTTMGEISVGDFVVGQDGKPVQVVAVHPQGEMDIYRVETSDGAFTKVTSQHLWEVHPHGWGNKPQLLETKEIAEELASGNNRFAYLPLVGPVEFEALPDLPIDPYALGLLLGDGYLVGTPTFCKPVPELHEELARRLPGIKVKSLNESRGTSILSTARGCPNPLLTALRELGLSGCRSWEKFIPGDYLVARVSQRLALLQGLMDTDGGVEVNSSGSTKAVFSTSSARLSEGLVELVQSLGGTAKTRVKHAPRHQNGTGRTAYISTVRLPDSVEPFLHGPKLKRWREGCARLTKSTPPTRRITSIEFNHREEAQCITVDSPDGLYVTQGYIVTHNSQLALKVAEHVHAQGLVPMFQSYEMSNLEQQQRFDALKAGISHSRLRRGALSHGEEHRYRAMLAEFEQAPDFYLTDTTVGTTVSSLAAKINQFNPDIVFVDGVYLMIDEHTGESGTPQALTSITRGLKRLAQRLDKPVVITTQALLWKMRGNRLSEGSIGYSSSVLQDSDVILGLEKVEDDETVRTLKILASRSCGPAETPLLWDWETGRFEEIAGDARASTEDDDDDEFDEYERVSA